MIHATLFAPHYQKYKFSSEFNHQSISTVNVQSCLLILMLILELSMMILHRDEHSLRQM